VSDRPTHRPSLTRRHAIQAAGGFLALAACGRGGAASGTLRVGNQRGTTKALMLAVGALDGAPYRVEWSEFPAAQSLLEALGSGAVDVGLVGDAPFQFAYQAGSPIVAVGAMAVVPPTPEGALAIIVPRGSAAHSIRDLVGKRIASTRGSIGHYLVLRALQQSDLPADAVHMVFLSPSDSQAALQTRAIDAWSTWTPYTVAALAQGARIAVDGRAFSNDAGFDVAHAGAAKTKRALIADFLARETKALAWAASHADDYAAVLARETGLPLAIARATALRNGRQRVLIDSGLIAAQQQVLDTFRQAGEVKAVRPLAQAFAPIT